MRGPDIQPSHVRDLRIRTKRRLSGGHCLVPTVRRISAQIASDGILSEKSARILHLIVGFVEREAKFRRELQRQVPVDGATQLGSVPAERVERFLAISAAERKHVGGGHAKVGRGAHLAHGDRHSIEIRIVDFSAIKDVGQCASNQFAHAQLPLRASVSPCMNVSRHGGDIISSWRPGNRAVPGRNPAATPKAGT